MTSFRDLSFVYKVIVLLSLLTLVSIGAAVFSTDRMRTIDDVYSRMVEGEAKAGIFVVRTNARLIDTGRLTYEMMAARDPQTIKKASAGIDDTAAALRKYADVFKKKMPGQAARMDEILARYGDLLTLSNQIKERVLVDDASGAFEIMDKKFQPGMDSLRANMNEIAELAMKDLDARSEQATNLTNTSVTVTYVAVIGGSAAVLGLALFLFHTMVSRPIMHLSEAMGGLAQREYGVAIEGGERKDEVGAMARAVAVFRDNMQRADQLEADQAKERQAREERAGRIEEITARFDSGVATVLQSVATAASQLQATASAMSATAEQTTRQATIVATAAGHASENVQTVAAASEQLASSIGEIGRQVSQSTRVAADAARQSDDTNTRIQGLAQSANRIGEVVKLISDIASQTNLLALNATIEAARAGDAGKGFAVVANEVKTLANQTGKATDEIAQQVGAVQAATEDAVQAIQGIGTTISEINQISTTIASAVEEQSAATAEIARNVQQAAAGTGEVTQTINGVSQAAETTGHSANDVLNAATALARHAESLKRQVQDFLGRVRSA
jgi:methyl-accepting chemotaxis protein